MSTPLRNNRHSRFVFFIISVAGLLISACKPTVSLSGASIPAEAQTVSVGIFKNNSSLGPPDLPQQFTEKLRDLVAQQTRLAMIAKNGDLQFEGYISDYNVSPVAANGDQASQNRLTITVQVIFFNKFEPAKNFERTFSGFADFAGTESITARGPALVQEIFRQISGDVFYAAFNNW
jgi:hypothetical protein